MPPLSTDDTNHTIGFTGVWKRGGPKLARILCLITSQNVTAPKHGEDVPKVEESLITSQNVTAPKHCAMPKDGLYCLITSQNVTAPKPTMCGARSASSLITSQNVTAPKRLRWI